MNEVLFDGTIVPATIKCLVTFWILLCFCFQSVSSQNTSQSALQQATVPPRGWNSYDAFCWAISEAELLESAAVISQRLLPYGYEYVVLDYLWYRKLVPGASTNSLGFDVIDEWGRMVPDPSRFPSSIGGKGLSEIANRVHRMGLKFGIHVMAGISTQAVNANTPILDTTTGAAYQESGRVWYAKDISRPDKACKWMPKGFMGLNVTSGAGKAFLRSLHEQYAAWGVDFVKHDCVFGDDLDLNEITYVSEILGKVNRPIVYSLSPGAKANPTMAKDVIGLVNMYRVTGDDWDHWKDLVPHFDQARDFASANMIGAKGLKGYSWPDLDMLPFGWLSNPDTNKGPYRFSNLTQDEQKTQMTLWAMAKSPLMFGGDVRKIDTPLYEILTNPSVLEINHFSSNNMEFPYVAANLKDHKSTNANNTDTQPFEDVKGIRSWIARGRKGEIYLAFFNLNEQKRVIHAQTSYLARVLPDTSFRSCRGKEAWSGKKAKPRHGLLSMDVESHGVVLFVMHCH